MDVISTLNDDVIALILSFLPVKSTVQTTVLSKRWYLLWTRVGYLDFRELSTQMMINEEEGGAAFANLVFNVLTQNTSSLRDLYINVSPLVADLQFFYFLIRSIGNRNVINLDLCLPRWYSLSNRTIPIQTIQPRFFNGNTIVRLTLTSVPLQIGGTVLLPYLRYINFESVEFADDLSLPHLLEGSPSLRELSITRTRLDNARVLLIYSLVLESLSYDNSYSMNGHGLYDYPVILRTPNLKDLNVEDYYCADITGQELPLLEEAAICVLLEPSHHRFFQVMRMCKEVVELNILLCDPQLYPPPWHPDVFAIGIMPLFDNLTKLNLEIFADDDTKPSAWLSFFYSSPRLVTFSLSKTMSTMLRWFEPYKVPRCLSSSLEDITFQGFNGSQNEMRMIGYFLEEGRPLKSLTIISIDLDQGVADNFNEQLLRLPRPTTIASHCDIDYINEPGDLF